MAAVVSEAVKVAEEAVEAEGLEEEESITADWMVMLRLRFLIRA